MKERLNINYITSHSLISNIINYCNDDDGCNCHIHFDQRGVTRLHISYYASTFELESH
jgi:hypothetical protein